MGIRRFLFEQTVPFEIFEVKGIKGSKDRPEGSQNRSEGLRASQRDLKPIKRNLIACQRSVRGSMWVMMAYQEDKRARQKSQCVRRGV